MDSATPMRTTRKAKSILNRLLESKSLSPEGMSWLTVATDPFHDSEVSCDGYPDISTSRSLVQVFTKTITVNRGVLPNTNTWDMHVFLNPCTPSELTDPQRSGAFYITEFDHYGSFTNQVSGVGVPFLYGGVNAVTVPTGTNLYGGSVFSAPGLQPPINLASGPFRLIACGFEVVNTTAELYKQGSMTCYKSPTGVNDVVLGHPNAPNINRWWQASLAAGPPSSQADAALYPNSRTWEAKEGCYMVCTMNRSNNFHLPAVGRSAGLLISRPANTSGQPTTMWYPYITNTTTSPANELLPFDVSGAIFTGLHPDSTMQVTVRYIMERVPSIAEPDLLVLTRTPAPYDPLALELYARTISLMPVGCMVKDNPLGEWFNDMLSTLGDIAPLVGRTVGNFVPGADLVGRAIGSAAKAGSVAMSRGSNVPASPNAGQKKKKKNPPQKQNPPGTGKRAQKKQ